MTDFLASWKAEALTEVELPSGRKVRGVLPSAFTLIEQKLLPTDLRAMAAKFDVSGINNVETMGAEELSQLVILSRAMGASFVRDGWDPETESWVPVRVTLEEFLDLPDRDQEILSRVALRAQEVAALTPFRGDRPVPPNRKNRRAVQRSTERATRSA